jgi:hypothetical protein
VFQPAKRPCARLLSARLPAGVLPCPPDCERPHAKQTERTIITSVECSNDFQYRRSRVRYKSLNMTMARREARGHDQWHSINTRDLNLCEIHRHENFLCLVKLRKPKPATEGIGDLKWRGAFALASAPRAWGGGHGPPQRQWQSRGHLRPRGDTRQQQLGGVGHGEGPLMPLLGAQPRPGPARRRRGGEAAGATPAADDLSRAPKGLRGCVMRGQMRHLDHLQRPGGDNPTGSRPIDEQNSTPPLPTRPPSRLFPPGRCGFTTPTFRIKALGATGSGVSHVLMAGWAPRGVPHHNRPRLRGRWGGKGAEAGPPGRDRHSTHIGGDRATLAGGGNQCCPRVELPGRLLGALSTKKRLEVVVRPSGRCLVEEMMTGG